MDRLVATAGPAGALLEAQGVIGTTDEDAVAADLLEVAFEAQIGITHREQLGIDCTVRGVADGATFSGSLVLENVRPALLGMAAETALVFGKQGGAATHERLAFVGRVAIGAGQPPLRHRMVAGQAELAAHVEVALETYGF